LLVAWHHRLRCLLVLGVQLCLLALSVLGLGLSGVALDVVHHALRPEAPSPRWPWGLTPPADWSALHAVFAVACAVVVMALVRTVLSFVYAVSVADLVQGRIVPTLRAEVYEKLQRLSFTFYDRHASGSLLNRG
jgi:ATP-binding cassette subfamily B protein